MTTANETAYPVTSKNDYNETGMTKRELFAALAMQGLLSYRLENAFAYEIADAAVEFADALIAELNKETP